MGELGQPLTQCSASQGLTEKEFNAKRADVINRL